MKKIFCLGLCLLIILGIAGCGTENTITKPVTAVEESVTIRLGGLKGPTTMGMVKLLDDAEKGTAANTYAFTMAASADELTPKLLNGELDIVAVPANLGAVLYNKSNGAVQMLAINTLGVLDIVQKGEQTVASLRDLKGKTIYATGKGSTPEYTLQYLLTKSGMTAEDVRMEWKSEPTEVIAAMSQKSDAIAMLPQPFATVASTQIQDLKIAIDLTREWEKLDPDSQLITAGLFVRTAFAKEHPAALKKFMTAYAASTKFVNENTEEAATLIEKYGIAKAAIAKKAIPYCNIVCMDGENMKTAATGYLEVLYHQKPAAVGGKMPQEDFYFLNM